MKVDFFMHQWIAGSIYPPQKEMLFLHTDWVENLGVQNWDFLVKRISIINNKFNN